MNSVWKRLQRVNKRAAKFQFTVSYHEVTLETTSRWKPNKLCVVWTRRNRRVCTEPMEWEPTLSDPMKGNISWPVPDNHTVSITLFIDSKNELEDKDWTFFLEDVSSNGKRRHVATINLNMKKYATLESSQQQIKLNLRPTTKKIVGATLDFTLSCVFLREGKATDEDMQSMASLMSVNNNTDIAPLDDFDNEDIPEDEEMSIQNLDQILDISAQLNLMTNSLTETNFPETPLSVASLSRDEVTPLIEESKYFPPQITLNGSHHETDSVDQSKQDDDEFFQNESNLERNSISRLSLRPLDLKKINMTSPRLKDMTPGQDLLEWCKDVTRGYSGIKVTNLTTAWKNGLAFCAIIHHFRPDLIDFDALTSKDVRGNCKKAFDAGEALGIPKVIEPADMEMLDVPDKLAVMTYLYQLRTYFTGRELEVKQIGKTTDESSYMIGRFSTDNDTDISDQLFGQEIINLRKKDNGERRNNKFETNRRSNSMDNKKEDNNIDLKNKLHLSLNTDRPDDFNKEKSPASVKDVKDIILAGSKSILEKVLSPTKEKFAKENSPKEKSKSPSPTVTPVQQQPQQRSVLITRHPLADLLGSDDDFEEELPETPQLSFTKSRTPESIHSTGSHGSRSSRGSRRSRESSENRTSTPINDESRSFHPLISRHDELRERARQLLEQARLQKSTGHSTATSPTENKNDEERRNHLRERARKLIADAKRGANLNSSQNSDDNASEKRSLDEQNNSPRRSGTPSTPGDRTSIKSVEYNGNLITNATTSSTEKKVGSPLYSFSKLMERVSPDKSSPDSPSSLRGLGKDMSSYIQNELDDLDREQTQIDIKAAKLEKELRAAMESDNEEKTETLMSSWFTLVNKKNALLRRQMQLNILGKEDDLERRFELLNRELRNILAQEEWQKTPEQKVRENLLLEELVSIVNKRDELVHHLDTQERAIEDDDEIQRNLSTVGLAHRNKNCVIQ